MMRIFSTHQMFAQQGRHTCARMCMYLTKHDGLLDASIEQRMRRRRKNERESKATVQTKNKQIFFLIELSFVSIISSLFNTIGSRKKISMFHIDDR